MEPDQANETEVNEPKKKKVPNTNKTKFEKIVRAINKYNKTEGDFVAELKEKYVMCQKHRCVYPLNTRTCPECLKEIMGNHTKI